MPTPRPGELDMYGNVIPEPPKPPEGLTPEQRLRLHYQDIESERAKQAALEAEADGIARSGLVQVKVAGAEQPVYLNPDTIETMMQHPEREDMCRVVTNTGQKLVICEPLVDFAARLAPAPEPPKDALERLKESYTAAQ